MKRVEEIASEVFLIYLRTGVEAEEYLSKARELREKLGLGFATVYCWFYSVPQKWERVESSVFELANHTNRFDLETVMSVPNEDIVKILRPIVFHNQTTIQLKNFCKAISGEFGTWESFADELSEGSIAQTLERLRRHKGTRLSFKNLAAMKIFIGMDDDLLILDRHVARVLGLSRSEQSKYKSDSNCFLNLVSLCARITEDLRKRGSRDLTTAKWSLAVWFDRAGLSAKELL